jgi:ubiquitin C-terminal hydrolase
MNVNNNMNQNINMNLYNNMNQIIFNQNFQNNNNNINNNFNQNNILFKYGNNIMNYIQKNIFLLKEIINYIQQKNINKSLFQIIDKLIQNDNIPFDYININETEKNICSLLDNLNQKNNHMNQANQVNINNKKQMNNNNNNQMNNHIQPIIGNLNKIKQNIICIKTLYDNYFQITEGKTSEINKEKKDNINDIFEFKDFGNYFPLIGLRNVGLTCYMNSILQCLLHIPELNGFFINKYPEKKNKLKKINKDVETGGRLCEEYHKIVEEINIVNIVEKKNYIIPKDFNLFLSNINGQFAQYEANDAKDLLLYLLQAMHSELNFNGEEKLKSVPKCNQTIEKESFNFFMTVNSNLNLSIISYLFYGINKSITVCQTCQKTLYNFQYFQFLSFPTFNFKNKLFNIYQGFKEFGKPELMTGDNKCYCQNCKGLRDAKVTTKIFFAPPYLIINFDYGKNKKFMPKEVGFGGIIDIIDFVDEYNKNNYLSIQYKLIAVSTHIGSSGRGGHYITYCQNNEDKWFEFNDSSVSPAKFEEINSNSPYILIYKKL